MYRYFTELSYKGTGFHGWQSQPNAVSVQEILDRALSVFFREPVVSVGCGRTDTGVHATQFFAHFDLHTPYGQADEDNRLEKAVNGINALLPYEIAVKRVFPVGPEAHARFDANSRAYHYHLHFNKDPFLLDRSWLFKGVLDVEAMNEAAALLKDYTDFSCFSKSHTQTFTNNCRITEAFFEPFDNGLRFTIRADRFLRNMVRAIVGTLVLVGKQEVDLERFREIIESKDRSNAGQSVPACGLYLVSVTYPFLS
ncbi:tRNA pseudouridine(38-40) synthase TruA [Pedobacter sp. JY14-1]|uniref:tRNA pseudouridine(38-40) synthase TruA n=1 Tax=Pedobacter sp. JY14-1 TaxID=3034151 RepID=UPI0023E241B0|nr:tRNA pseudouridine(38-40) synthase TruA [Pedobacter sp. JY14-1]